MIWKGRWTRGRELEHENDVFSRCSSCVKRSNAWSDGRRTCLGDNEPTRFVKIPHFTSVDEEGLVIDDCWERTGWLMSVREKEEASSR